MRHTIDIKELVESAIKDRDGNVKEAQNMVVDKLAKPMANEKVQLGDFSIKEAFRQFCDRDRRIDESTDAEQIAEAIQGSAFPRFMYQAITPIIAPAYESSLGDVLKLVTQENTTKQTVIVPGLGNFDRPQKVGAGNDYPHDGAEAYDCTIEMHKYGNIIDLTKEAILADEPGVIRTRAAAAGRYMGELIHEVVIKKIANITTLLINGEAADTAFVYNGTGYAHFSNDHSSIDGQTNDNIETTALGDTGLTNLWTQMRLQKDNRGRPMTVNPKWLIIPETLGKLAGQLIKSVGEVGNANNEDNFWKGRFNIFSSPFLDDNSTGLYYLGDPKIQTYLFWRWKPTTTVRGNLSEDAFKRDIVSQYKYSSSFNAGMLDYRYIGRGGS